MGQDLLAILPVDEAAHRHALADLRRLHDPADGCDEAALDGLDRATRAFVERAFPVAPRASGFQNLHYEWDGDAGRHRIWSTEPPRRNRRHPDLVDPAGILVSDESGSAQTRALPSSTTGRGLQRGAPGGPRVHSREPDEDVPERRWPSLVFTSDAYMETVPRLRQELAKLRKERSMIEGHSTHPRGRKRTRDGRPPRNDRPVRVPATKEVDHIRSKTETIEKELYAFLAKRIKGTVCKDDPRFAIKEDGTRVEMYIPPVGVHTYDGPYYGW